MRFTSVLRYLAIYSAAVGVGATVAISCIGVNYPTVAFRCNPRQSNNCPETHFCCSDDPAAEGGALPGYEGKNVSGGKAPYFSGKNNALGTSGMCVNRDQIPPGAGLIEPQAASCPIPCNPTWDAQDVVEVCGSDTTDFRSVCCQTVDLDPKDCVLDPDDEDIGFRPASGQDIGTFYDAEKTQPVTNWSPGAHVTHQDPAGQGCAGHAGGDKKSPIFEDCVAQLTVADQRGFCMKLEKFPVMQECPTKQPTYVDACTLRNQTGGAPPPG